MDVAERDNPPLDVFAVERVRACRVEHIDHFTQRDSTARRRFDDGLCNHVRITARRLVIPNHQSKVTVFVEDLGHDATFVCGLQQVGDIARS